MSKNEKVFVSDLPNLLIDWHSTKNDTLALHNITAGSHKKVWWKCHVCKYEWKTSVNHVNHGTGCRVCKHKDNYAKKRKKVINLDTGVIFDSISSAAKYYNVDVSLISMCCSGKTKTAHGYRWKLLDNIAPKV